jgi:hypothetical protein
MMRRSMLVQSQMLASTGHSAILSSRAIQALPHRRRIILYGALWVAIGAAALAVIVYGGYAAWTWARYGHPQQTPVNAALDRFIAKPEVIERNRITVSAPAAVAYDACRNFDLLGSTIPRLLFDTRALAMGAKPVHQESPAGLVDQMTAMGWSVLEETPGRQIVFGVAAQPWRPDAGFRKIPPADFAAFTENGWVKIVVSISVTPSDGSSLVRTETRVMTTDAEARKRFRKYWALASPGVKLIRVLSLRSIRSSAEAHTRRTASI